MLSVYGVLIGEVDSPQHNDSHEQDMGQALLTDVSGSLGIERKEHLLWLGGPEVQVYAWFLIGHIVPVGGHTQGGLSMQVSQT